MMTLAELQIKVDATQAEIAAEKLAKLKASGLSAADAEQKLAEETRRAAEAQKILAREAALATGQTKALQNAGLNLGRQFSDVGVSLASGINPLMVLIQQGPQIADALAQAKTQGVGLSAVMRGLAAQVAPLLPLLAASAAAAGVVGGAYLAWKKNTDDLAAALKASKKVAEDFVEVQNSTRSALSSAIDFAEKYRVTNVGLTQALDKLLVSQNSAYGATLASIDANDRAGQSAARRAELERLLTADLLRQAEVRAEARAKEAEVAAKDARKAASGAGFWASVGAAYRGAEMPGSVDAIGVGQAAEARKLKETNVDATERAAKAEREYAAQLKASREAMMGATLTIPPATKAKAGLTAAERERTKAAREAAAADKAFEEQIKRLTESLSTPAEKAMRDTVAATALLRQRFEEGKLPLEQYIELFERLHPVVVEAKDAQKAFTGDVADSAAELAKGVKGLDAATDAAADLAAAFSKVRFSIDDMFRSIKSGDIGSLLLNVRDLATGIPALLAQGPAGYAQIGSLAANAIGGRTGRAVGGGLGIAAGVYGLGSLAGAGSAVLGGAGVLGGVFGGGAAAGGLLGGLGGALGAFAAAAGPIAIAAGALYAAAKIFNVGGKPTNAGAGFDLRTGAISGNKRTSETEDAARAAGEAIQGIQAALKAAGIGITDAVTGLVIGTRDQTQIYLESGRTLRSAVGDSGAAVDAALAALVEGATYVSEAQKKLVESAVATGKGFDAVAEVLAKYESAQSIGAGLADEILRLKSVSAGTADYDLAQVRKGIDEQRKAASALATEGYLTAEQLAGINAQLEILQGLQIDEVMKRYVVAVDTVTAAANDNLTAAAEARDNAEGILRDAYQREADAINARADQFRNLADGLRKFEESLRPNLAGRGGYSAARAAFERTSALAATGDVKALGALQGVSEAYLAAARSVAPDARAYARDLAAVRNAVQSSAMAAEAQVTQAEAQLAALRDQVGALIKIDATLATVAQAIGGFSSAVFTLAVEQGRSTQTPEERAGGVAPPPAPTAPTVTSDPQAVAAIERQNELLAEQNRLLAEIAKSGGTTANVLQRSTRDGEGFVIAA